ncbi:hypothetical protein DXG01_002946 [Tephrocybe rancida]|nr:hypothetical protein DXG01_002946 [Tephrocybe rancida]
MSSTTPPMQLHKSGESSTADASITNTTTPSTVPNILIFGETGVGKSSIINMLAREPVAKVSSDAVGQTFGNVPHPIEFNGTQIVAWDTAGLNESEYGTVHPEKAIDNLRCLAEKLDGRINLLVYCIKASRFRQIWKINYDIFVSGFCQGKVPVVLIVTGCEDEVPDMEDWWTRNASVFSTYGLGFDGHACITVTKGRELMSGEHMFDKEYKESERVVRQLVLEHLDAAPTRVGGHEAWNGFAAWLIGQLRALKEKGGNWYEAGIDKMQNIRDLICNVTVGARRRLIPGHYL